MREHRRSFEPTEWQGHFTPLHAAAEVGWEKGAAAVAIEFVGFARCHDEFGRLPYEVALEFGHDEIAKPLQKLGEPESPNEPSL